MKKACLISVRSMERFGVFILIFLAFILTSGISPAYAQAPDYDSVNDVISQSFAKRIADLRCLQYFGKKELFDVEKYYDEKDKIAVYVFIYKAPEYQVTKDRLLKELQIQGAEFNRARLLIQEGGQKKNYQKVLEGRVLGHQSLSKLYLKDEFCSIYVSASKTHMPVIEWRKGLPESYTLVESIKRVANTSEENIKIYYYGPQAIQIGIEGRPWDIYLLSNDQLKKVQKDRLGNLKFRRPLADNKIREQIEKTWDVYASQSLALLNNVSTAEKILSPMPDFRQYEFDHLFGANSAGTCGVMAVADVLGYYDQFIHGNSVVSS